MQWSASGEPLPNMQRILFETKSQNVFASVQRHAHALGRDDIHALADFGFDAVEQGDDVLGNVRIAAQLDTSGLAAGNHTVSLTVTDASIIASRIFPRSGISGVSVWPQAVC